MNDEKTTLASIRSAILHKEMARPLDFDIPGVHNIEEWLDSMEPDERRETRLKIVKQVMDDLCEPSRNAILNDKSRTELQEKTQPYSWFQLLLILESIFF